MSEISAADVKKLRDMTGAGMMDCKKALGEANGDFEAAIDYLRKQGQKLSVKRADREAKEGVVYALVSDDRKRGVIVKLSCETDFVAKNNDFVALTGRIAEAALTNFPSTLEELAGLPFEDVTIGEKVIEQVGIIGEKIELAQYERLEAPQVVAYIHMGYKAAVLVGLNQDGEALIQAGKDVAMQVAAMKPIAVDKDGVDTEVLQRELEIAKEQTRMEGKPEEMVEKIAQGRLNKFFKESTLLAQDFVKDGSKTVSAYLDGTSKGLTVTAFKHVTLG